MFSVTFLLFLLVLLSLFIQPSWCYVPDSSIQHRAIKPKFHPHYVRKNVNNVKEHKQHLLGFLLADFRQRVPSYASASSSRVLVFVLTDENMSPLEGDFRRGNCDIIIQSVPRAGVDKMSELVLSYKGHELPDWLIFHVGANDIVPEVPMTAEIVVSKLQKLQKTITSVWMARKRRLSSHVVLSSILPKVTGHPNFNEAVRRINNEMLMYSQRLRLPYVNNEMDFWVNDHLITEMFLPPDNKLSPLGIDVIKKRLLQNIDCTVNRSSLHPLKIPPGFDKGRKLELSDVLPEDQDYYDKHIPPKFENGPTVVYFHVTVLTIDTIDEESMTYVTDIFLAQSWHDYRLRLPKNMTEEYRILDINWLKHIWCPDTFVKNAKQVTFHEMSVPNHYLWIHHNKNILYMAKITLVLSCPMTFKNYPHDTQVCSMLIESLSHRTDDLVFKWNLTYPLVVNPEIELPQLDVVESTTKDCTLEYSTGNFTCLAVVFTLRRRLGYHLFHTYIPTGLIVVMSWISFWISPEAVPARVTLAVTSLLTLATQNTQSQASLPPVSYVKAIDVWMSSCTVFVFSSLMEYAVVTYFMRYGNKFGIAEDDSAIPGDCINARTRTKSESEGSLLRGMHRYLFGRNVTMTDFLLGKTSASYKQHMRVSLAIDNFSRFFFPFSFILLNIVYWTTFL